MTTDVYEYSASRSNWARAANDLKRGWERRNLWGGMAVRAFNNRYKGALIGGFWLTITTAMTAIGLGLLYGQLFGHAIETHLPYVTIGIVVWALISSYAGAGCEVFVGNANIFKEFPLPLSIFPYRLALSQLIYTGYRLIILAAMMAIFPASLAASAPLALLGIALLFWIGFWVSFIFGVINARYRDFGQMVGAAMTFIFFMTPIFWRTDRLGEYSWLVQYNPFYHLIQIVRGPLLGHDGFGLSFIVAAGLAVMAPLVAFFFYGRFSHRLAYWC